MTDHVSAELAEVIAAGSALIPDVELVVARCRTEPDPGRDLAVECGRIASAYFALRKRLWPMPKSELRDTIEGLLNYQQQLVEQASMLAYRPHDSHWDRLASRFGAGGGAPADELARLADQISSAD